MAKKRSKKKAASSGYDRDAHLLRVFQADAPIGNNNPTMREGRLITEEGVPNWSNRATGGLRQMRGKYT